MIAAAERGLEDSRRAIAALSAPLDEPLDTALGQAVERVAARSGIRLVLDLAADLRVDPGVREGLIRIACEAVNNAANHSGASQVSVELVDGPPLRLRIRDDGEGFDPADVADRPGGGFGLTSMRERAAELGASLEIDASPGRGTRVEVELA